MLEELDLTKLFDTESNWGKEYIMAPLTDEMIKRAESTIGYKLPQSYPPPQRPSRSALPKEKEAG